MFVGASTRCFGEVSFPEACRLLTDLEYDKIDLWLDESSDHLKPSEIAADPERFYGLCRETTRLTPVAITLEHDVDSATFASISKLAKLMRITQITIPASPLGTPFNAEIDRLKGRLQIANQDGVRLSIKTKSGQLTEDPHTAIELCQAVRGIGITLDPSYYICGPHHAASYDLVLPYVFHVHLRDTTKDELQVQIGLGEIEYARLIQQLSREQFNRALCVELIPELIGNVDRALELRKMRMLLETLL